MALVVSLEPAGMTLPVEIHLHQYGWLGKAKIWISLVVLLTVLGLIALEVIHRYNQSIAQFHITAEIWELLPVTTIILFHGNACENIS